MAILAPLVLTNGTRTAATIPLFAGIDLTAALTAAEIGGDSFPNDGKTLFRIKNTGSQITMTITRVKASDQGVLENIVATIPPTTSDLSFGPFPAGEFNDVNGRVIVTYSGVTGVTVKALRMSENGR